MATGIQRSLLAAVSLLAVVSSLVQASSNLEAVGKEMTVAANNLLESLTPPLRAQASFQLDDEERINWHFIPRDRKGVPIKSLSEAQRDRLRELLKTGTSLTGFEKSMQIMALEAILREIENTPRAREIRNPELYYVSIFGKPGPEGRWGWRVEGHHLSINYTIENGRVLSGTPLFLGSNPARVPSGPKKGLRVLAEEEDLARRLFQSLSADQQKKAKVSDEPPPDILTGDRNVAPKPLPHEGIRYADLEAEQQKQLMGLIRVYTDRQPTELSQRLMAEIESAGLEKISFGWWGSVEPGKPHYYRVLGSTFVIEYNNTQNQGNHAHTVLRSYTSDFGQEKVSDTILRMSKVERRPQSSTIGQ